MHAILPDTAPIPAQLCEPVTRPQHADHPAATHYPWCDSQLCRIDDMKGFDNVLYDHVVQLLDAPGLSVKAWRAIEVCRDTGEVRSVTQDVSARLPEELGDFVLSAEQAGQLGAALTAAAAAIAPATR